MMRVSPKTRAPDEAPTVVTVAVVDDAMCSRILVKKKCMDAFKGLTVKIDEADDGLKGWELCQQKRYSVYVIDGQMPGMPGVDLVSNIIECHPDAYVIFYSATESLPPALQCVHSVNKGDMADLEAALVRAIKQPSRKNSSQGDAQ